MFRRVVCLFAIFLSCQCVFPQASIKGRVISGGTGKPLPSVSVYLNNTTKGTVTNEYGLFAIDRITPGKFRLVASCIGYETYVKFISPRDLSEDLIITLKPKPEQLKDVNVRPFDPNGWEKFGKLFTQIFIGTNPNSYKCQLKNPDVLKFRLNDDNTLTVVASEPIQIRNNALGYEMNYKLEEFEYDFTSKVITYNGYALFKDMSLAHPNKALKWLSERSDTYEISLLHFMRAFFVNELVPEGFEMRSLAKISNPDKERAKKMFSIHKDSVIKRTIDTVYEIKLGAISTTVHTADSTSYYKQMLLQPDTVISRQIVLADSLGFAADSSTAGLYFPDSLEISYRLKDVPNEYKKLSKSHKNDSFPVSQFVFLNKKPVFVLSSGYYYGPYDLKITGFWAWWETMSTLLPYDYIPIK
jgi:hypothetical protein